MLVISTLCEGGDPAEVFTIPRVTTPDPDNPGRYPLLGYLTFTNRVIYFAQIAESKSVDVEVSGAFGFVGTAAEALIKAEQKKCAEDKIWAQEIKGSRNFRGILEKADRLIVFPKETIIDIGYSRLFGLKIKMRSNWHGFWLEDKEKTYRSFEPKIKEYLNK